mgnify:CR=1 FL=1
MYLTETRANSRFQWIQPGRQARSQETLARLPDSPEALIERRVGRGVVEVRRDPVVLDEPGYRAGIGDQRSGQLRGLRLARPGERQQPGGEPAKQSEPQGGAVRRASHKS